MLAADSCVMTRVVLCYAGDSEVLAVSNGVMTRVVLCCTGDERAGRPIPADTTGVGLLHHRRC